jgi:hypothetical protein
MKVYPIHNWDEVEYDGLVTNWIYLHGQLEKDNGYDLCWIPFLGCVPPYRTGIFKDFEIKINGEVRKVNIYVWSGKEDNSEVMEAVKELDELFTDFKDKTNLWRARELVNNIMYYKGDGCRISEGYHGLVVYADDDEANEYAQKAYEERPNHI